MENNKKVLDSIIELIDTNYFNKTTGVLSIPNGIEEINGDFYYRKNEVDKLQMVKGVVIPKSVNKIGKYAFRKTDISRLEIPDNVKEIELGAFESCTKLIEFVVKGKKVPIVERDSFLACENLERFYNDNGSIDVKTDFRISNQAFSTCYKLLNEQGRWLMVVPEKQNSKIFNYIEKIKKFIITLVDINGAQSVNNKF